MFWPSTSRSQPFQEQAIWCGHTAKGWISIAGMVEEYQSPWVSSGDHIEPSGGTVVDPSDVYNGLGIKCLWSKLALDLAWKNRLLSSSIKTACEQSRNEDRTQRSGQLCLWNWTKACKKGGRDIYKAPSQVIFHIQTEDWNVTWMFMDFYPVLMPS